MTRRAGLFILAGVLTGCATAARPLSVVELLANPAASENQNIQIRGCYLYRKGGISALSEVCPANLSNDYRPYGASTVDLVPPDQNAPLAGHYVDVTGIFHAYGRKPGVFPTINFRGVSDIGQIDVSRIRRSKTRERP